MRPEKQATDPPENDASHLQSKPSNPSGLRLIAGFKIAQGLILALVGTGLLMLLTGDADAQVAHWLTALQRDTNNDFARRLLSKLDAMSPMRFKRLSVGAFLYAAVLMTEGTGLLLQKRWAEFLTVLVTGSFIPLEFYEVANHFNMATLAVLAANLIVVWYLVKTLMNKHPRKGSSEHG